MGEAGQQYVFQRARLFGDGGGDARLAMAVDIGPPARHRIKVAPAIGADQPRAFAAHDRHQWQQVGVFAHLGARVPDRGEITGNEIVFVQSRLGYHHAT